MLQYLNELSALVGLPILLLGLRGFAPHVWRVLTKIVRGEPVNDPRYLLAIAAFGMDLKGAVRMSYWDLYRPFHRLMTDTPTLGSLEGQLFNAGINSLSTLMGLLLLWVLYLAIPEERRHAYSIWTAPFFPIKNRERIV